VGELVASHTDPFSGQPEAKATAAAIIPADLPLRGFVRARRLISLPAGTWWTRVATSEGWEYLIATESGPLIWHDFAHRIFGGDARLSEALDEATCGYRAAAFRDGEVDGCLSVGPEPLSAQRAALRQLLASGATMQIEGSTPIVPVPDDRWADTGPVICACLGVGMAAIRDAVGAGARNVAELGRATGAGTNCGSCLPELKRILARERLANPV
jgi:assimilatory nitrate reductase catalytic subunit